MIQAGFCLMLCVLDDFQSPTPVIPGVPFSFPGAFLAWPVTSSPC